MLDKCAVAYTARMLSPEDIARIKAGLVTLEKARDNCADSGVRKVIDAWIEAAKRPLVGKAKDQKEQMTVSVHN